MQARSNRFPSRRSPVLGTHGMVATSQPLAALAGLRALQAGGNAADAAITMAVTLNVVEPHATGAGGDAFALVRWANDGKVRAMNGSGRAPAAVDPEALRQKGWSEMQPYTPYAVTVPGSVSAWYELYKEYGSLPWRDLLAPAIHYAEEGFPVSPLIARRLGDAGSVLLNDEAAMRNYMPGGRTPKTGEIFRQPDLARTLSAVADEGPSAFYEGAIGRAIAEAVQRKGGWLDESDLRAHRTTWDDPIKTDYHGVTVYEHPPNGQGLVALMALNTVEAGGLAGEWGSPEAVHLLAEAMKLAFADGYRWIADPAMADLPIQGLLSPAYAAQRRALISERAIEHAEPGVPPANDTVYLSAVDGEGNAVSFINSLFHGFGSGIVAPGTGVCLQNRGCLFSLDPSHPNYLKAGRRPYHTIIPAMACRGDDLWMSFGVMGGFMQPQGHMQVVVNLLDFGMSYQEALDAPRWRVERDGRLLMEAGFPAGLREALAARGHELLPEEPAFSEAFGGGQIVARDPETGVLWGASDPRKDGCAAGW